MPGGSTTGRPEGSPPTKGFQRCCRMGTVLSTFCVAMPEAVTFVCAKLGGVSVVAFRGPGQDRVSEAGRRLGVTEGRGTHDRRRVPVRRRCSSSIFRACERQSTT